MQRVAPRWQSDPRCCQVASTWRPLFKWPGRPSPANVSLRNPDPRPWARRYMRYSFAAGSSERCLSWAGSRMQVSPR
eukprot:3900569-Pyramimonas_sp.AAC.1